MKNIKILAIFTLSIAVLSFANKAQAADMKPVRGISTTGLTGIINVATADTVNSLGVGTYFTSDFGDSTALLPRVSFGFLNCLEVAGGANMAFNDFYVDGNLAVKWKFYDQKIKMAVSTNFQFNDTGDGLGIDAQMLLHFTWHIGEFYTTAVIGKTIGDNYNNWNDWDFGMGAEWWFFNSGSISMGTVFDFTNYDFKVDTRGMATGNQDRGNYSQSLRMGFANKVILVDIGGMDLLDGGRSFFMSAAVDLSI